MRKLVSLVVTLTLAAAPFAVSAEDSKKEIKPAQRQSESAKAASKPAESAPLATNKKQEAPKK